jgi:hypothetical protein
MSDKHDKFIPDGYFGGRVECFNLQEIKDKKYIITISQACILVKVENIYHTASLMKYSLIIPRRYLVCFMVLSVVL